MIEKKDKDPIDMKKGISFFLAFLIVSAVIAIVIYFVGYIFDIPAIRNLATAVGIGLSVGLAGTLGPIISEAVSKMMARK